jgi:hypothetical protein
MAKPRQSTGQQPRAQQQPRARPAPSAQPPEAVAEPPGSVRLAVRLMYAGAALAALDLIVTLTTVGKARSILHAAEPHWSASRVTTTVHTEIAYFVVTWAITIALWLVMARTNLAGRGWARIVSTILCVLSTLSFAEYVTQPSSLLSKLILVPMWLVGVGAVVLLWQRATTEYIRAGKT